MQHNIKFICIIWIIFTFWISGYECKQQNSNRGGNKGNNNYDDRLENHNNNVNNDGSIARNNGGGGGGGGHRRGHRKKHHRHNNMEDNDISLWINEQQLQMLSGNVSLATDQGVYLKGSTYCKFKALFFPQSYLQGRIYAIENGHVVHDIRDSNIYKYLTIPSEVNYVNFTWKSGTRKYFYHFDRLQTLDESILKAPTLSIKTKGRIPQDEKRPDPECNLKCGNNGFCNHNICQCKAGYTGINCQTAFCFPQCLNGGNCTAPSVCTCPEGYQGTQCEGGICAEKCLNGGKCIQKDKCQCSKGYYGLHCEYSKCVIPCKNGGRCIGTNLCRCPNGLRGNHCEIGRKQRSTCKRPCKHGQCMPNKTCKCHSGFYGRFCNGRIKKHRQTYR